MLNGRDVLSPRGLRAGYYVVVGLLAAMGVGVLGYRLAEGMQVTSLTTSISWGMWVSAYIYFVGLSAGSFLLSTMIYVFGMKQFEKVGRMALLSAFFSLTAALLFVWVDLGHPWRAWRIFFEPHWTSVMTIESWLYLVYMFIIVAELWLLMRADLARMGAETPGLKGALYQWLALGYDLPQGAEEAEESAKWTRRWVTTLGILGVPTAIGVHGGTGAIFAVAIARPYWFSPLLPIIFLVSALVSGTALVLFIYAFFGKRDAGYRGLLEGLGGLLLLFIAIDVVLLMFDALISLYGQLPDHADAWKAIVTGKYAFVFWIGQVGMAALVPIFLVGFGRARLPPAWLGVAGLSTVLGIVAVRLNIVIPGFVVPELKGLDTAFIDSRLAYNYFPSAWEWLSTIGLVAVVVLAFSLAYEFLPLYEREEETGA